MQSPGRLRELQVPLQMGAQADSHSLEEAAPDVGMREELVSQDSGAPEQYLETPPQAPQPGRLDPSVMRENTRHKEWHTGQQQVVA